MLTDLERKVLDIVNKGENRPILLDANTIRDTLNKVKGHTFVSCVTVTEPKMRKTGNPYLGRVRKVTKFVGAVNFDYDNAVENAREREGKDREDWSKGESWSRPITRPDGTLTPFACHKDDPEKIYFRIRQIEWPKSEYFIDGERVDESALEDWLIKSKPAANQGLENAVRMNTPLWENVRAVSVNGETYYKI